MLHRSKAGDTGREQLICLFIYLFNLPVTCEKKAIHQAYNGHSEVLALQNRVAQAFKRF